MAAVRSAGAVSTGSGAGPTGRARLAVVWLLIAGLVLGGSGRALAADDETPALPLDPDVEEALGEAPAAPTVLAPSPVVAAGEPIGAFVLDLPATGRHWVALARPDYPPNAYDARILVDPEAPDEPLQFPGTAAGLSEIRLFLDWPAGSFAIVSRAPVLVSDNPDTDRSRARRLARVLASLPADALNDRLRDRSATAAAFPTAANVTALARAFAAEAAAFGDVAAEYESGDALAAAIGLGAAAVDLDPGYPEARLILARAYLAAPGTVEFHADAEAVLRPLLASVPDDPRPRLLLARIAVEMGDFAAAADVVVPLLDAGPAADGTAALLVAAGYARAGNPQSGIARLRDALGRDPDRQAVRLALAVLLKHAGHTEEAARELRQVAETAATLALRAVALRLAGASP